MQLFNITSAAGRGTVVELGQDIPAAMQPVSDGKIREIAGKLRRPDAGSPYEEVVRQNRDLMIAIQQLRERGEELARLNRELEDTNRGIIALYAELEDKAEALRRADETKTVFLRNVSHELRNPINTIMALSSILASGPDLPGDGYRQVSLMHEAAETLLELVNDLLDLAKIQAGKIEVRWGAVKIEHVFSALRGMMKPLQVNEKVELQFDISENFPIIVTDEVKLSQVLRNLVSNGLKFTEVGEVRVSARLDKVVSEGAGATPAHAEEDGRARRPAPTEEGARAILEVRDTGVGIPPEEQEHIFEEFVQLRNPLQRKYKGTGLGLSITRRLVGLLGGRISVESEPGRGSVFRVELPLDGRSSQAGGEDAERQGAAAGGSRPGMAMEG